jgi:predicted KAP-like P-loop ATPase
LTYPLVRDEVSFPDFFALEAFRTQRHIVYDTIRDSPNIFLGPEPFLAPPLNQDYLNKFHEGWLAKIEDAERRWIRAVVTAMFPRSGLTGWPAEEREKPEWHRTRRICCRSVFPTYFRCALPEDEIPSATVRQIVSGQLDESAIQQILVKFTNEKTHDEKLKIGYLLKQIGDYFPENISRVAVSPIVNALFEQGDVILRNTEEEQRDFLDFPTDRAVLGSIRPLLSLLPKNDRTDLLRSVVARSPALTTLVLVLTSFGEDHGKYGSQKTRPEETLVDEDALADLEKTALERIQQSADQDSLLNVPDLRFALYRWGDWGGRNKRTEWIQNVARDPSRLPRLLEAFVGVTREYGAQATMRYTLFEKLARELLPPDIAPTLRTIDRSSLSDRQQFAVNQMIALYDSQSNTEKE